MYNALFIDVQRLLAERDGEATSIGAFPFRKRSEHSWRVYVWAKRLIDEGAHEAPVDREALLVAALFHDVGYSASLDAAAHAEHGAALFREYAAEKGLDEEQTRLAAHLIAHHSKKELLACEDTPLELVLLMEADLLDETGALSIVWDCMMEGGQPEQSFAKTYEHIVRYSGKLLQKQPMRTAKAREFWAEKQELLALFIKHLAFDLAITDTN